MQVGYAGKLPAYGDFVQGGASVHACKAWSDWAERGLSAARDTVGGGFPDMFLTSPIWRFAVAEHVFGPNPVAGVFCPSMDKVGRLFPFAVLSDLPAGVLPMPACLALGPWFDRIEAAVLAALDTSARIEDLTAAISDPDPLRPNGDGRTLAATPGLSGLSVSPTGEPIQGDGDLLDLSEHEEPDADGAWITLGGIDDDAWGVMQYGIATDALFARLVTGGDAHGT